MRSRFVLFALAAVLFVISCKKDKPAIPPKGVKTAANGYNKTVTDGSSIIGSWKNVSSISYFYDINGVQLAQGSPGLIDLKIADSTHITTTTASGNSLNEGIYLNNVDSIMYLNFVSDEGFNTYAIDTLEKNKFVMLQIVKSPAGIIASINGVPVKSYQVTTIFSYTRSN